MRGRLYNAHPMKDEPRQQAGSDPERSDPAPTRLAGGRRVSPEELASLVYDDLRRIAASFFRGSQGQTLQPTALVHEAYLRLADQERADWQNRAHFLAVAARMMRRVLIDAARARGAEKRGGALQRVTLLTDVHGEGSERIDLLELEDALQRLGKVKPRFVRIVELRFFSGLTTREVADVLGLSERQVTKDWRMARSYLEVFLEGDSEEAARSE